MLATDLGVPPLSNQATVNITVTDTNDNPPVFLQSKYSAQVGEEIRVGQKVLQVRTLIYIYSASLFKVMYFVFAYYIKFLFIKVSRIKLST